MDGGRVATVTRHAPDIRDARRSDARQLPGRIWLAVAALVALVVVAPLAVTRIPPMVDYPNHLARMHVLATGAASPALARMFEIDWAFIPNMAMDLVVPLLAQAMALDVAGRLFIALAMLLPPLGVVALHRAWFGRSAGWPWIAVLASANAFIFFGFLNYVVGVGMALLAAAWHARWLARPAKGWFGAAVLAALWGIACILSHLTALALLLLLMVSTELGNWRGGTRPQGNSPHRNWLGRVAVALAAVVTPLALYKAFGPTHNYASGGVLGQAVAQIREFGLFSDPHKRAIWSIAAFAAAVPWVASATAALVVAAPAAAALQRRLAIAPQMLLAAGSLAVAYLVLPTELADNGMVYQRLALPLALVLLAGVWPRLSPRLALGFAAAAVALVGVRSALLGVQWQDQNVKLAQLEQVIAAIPPGARVLAVRDGTDAGVADPDERGAQRVLLRTIGYQHLAALVTLERDAFEPLIFSAPGKQPLRLRAPYEQNAQSDGTLPLTSQLPDGLAHPAPGGRCGFLPDQTQCQLFAWPTRYDYVLRLNAHDAASPDRARLSLVAADGWAALYRVTGTGG
jgi:hypothetical protein